jgi:GTP-binding protein
MKSETDFFDQATIIVRAGNGGNGAATFRREKYVPRGGPNGGDGGRGGHVYLIADPEYNTLLHFRYQRKFVAENGGHGGKNAMHGRNGADVYVPVPPGTVVRTTIDGVTYSVDLARPGQRLLAARGGRGGLGNIHFATSTRQTPRLAELGEPGQELTLELELKMLADVGLIGFPNAGKSTLLSVISAARPKIAAYPFTTLTPNLGIVEVGLQRFVVADIPGLIEGAHAGVGLGHDFLRHVERTRLLIHIIDAAGVDGRKPWEDYEQINTELRLYQPELAQRKQVVALNKADLPAAQENLPILRARLPVAPEDLFVISAATSSGIEPLLQRVAELLRADPPPQRDPVDPNEPPLQWPLPPVDENAFTIEREDDGFRVRGIKIERLIAMSNLDQDEAIDRIQRVLEASGINEALIAAGVQDGDVVRIGRAELVWDDSGRHAL